eukprot:1082366-Prorocentrum_minimum.AAC.1
MVDGEFAPPDGEFTSWTVNLRPWTVNSPPWTVNSPPWTVNSRRRPRAGGPARALRAFGRLHFDQTAN